MPKEREDVPKSSLFVQYSTKVYLAIPNHTLKFKFCDGVQAFSRGTFDIKSVNLTRS